MSHWIVIRTDVRKEDYVCRQIAQRGFDAWVPTEVIRCRTGASRRHTSAKTVIATRELPVLAKTLFAAIPIDRIPDLRIRHLKAIHCYNGEHEIVETWTDANGIKKWRFNRVQASMPTLIPHAQIKIHRDAIDVLNREVLALAAIQTRKQKAKWRDLKSALQELLKPEAGKMEEAA